MLCLCYYKPDALCCASFRHHLCAAVPGKNEIANSFHLSCYVWNTLLPRYYVLVPICLVASQAIPASQSPTNLPAWNEAGRRLHWWHVAGAAVFLWGCWHQYKCHVILVSVRVSARQPVWPEPDPPRLPSCIALE